MHLRKIIILVAAVLADPVIVAQNVPVATTGPLTFAVATIKPSRSKGWKLQPTPDGYTAIGVSLRKLVQDAYGVFDDKLLVGGPDWFSSDKFDLEAKFDAAAIPDVKDLTYRQRADMLRPLLAERFKLKLHTETRTFPVYNLVIAKGGPKLQPAKTEDGGGVGITCHVLKSRPGITQRHDCTVASLDDLLRYETGRTVIDKTGLMGHYDLELQWTPENDSPTAAASFSGPSIFTALPEQLGLKLEPATAPLDVLMIDHVEQPSEN